MIRTSRIPLMVWAVLTCAALVIGAAAYAPWSREKTLNALGVAGMSKVATAANYCPVEPQTYAADSDRIYFLSCGGIY